MRAGSPRNRLDTGAPLPQLPAVDSTTIPPPSRWSGTGWDVAAFAAGLGLAWYFRWETRDLVWSLWLSSLVVGYSMILWSLFAPAVALAREGQGDKAAFAVAGGVVLTVFFTVHFGMFHFVHSVFLNAFFPVGPKTTGLGVFGLYGEVMARYWWFVPAALVAERQAFRITPLPPEPLALSVRAADIAARKLRQSRLGLGGGVMRPYVNVVRLHLLIFFFAAAHFAKVDHFAVYALVSAVYFFPWRRLRREEVGRGQPVTR